VGGGGGLQLTLHIVTPDKNCRDTINPKEKNTSVWFSCKYHLTNVHRVLQGAQLKLEHLRKPRYSREGKHPACKANAVNYTMSGHKLATVAPKVEFKLCTIKKLPPM
jgi:hypothetical protein